ncbi:MAG TPA: tetratricopeptide repeat protein [Longimicrobiales bacterium]|nr:tetratricopeptide repeat protein [Longimicrobiales bacterium]
MKRWSSAILAALLLVPAAAQAQRPSNNVHTRSADVYLTDAFDPNTNPGDRLDILKKAVEAATKGTQNDPNNPKPWFQLGRAQAGLGNFLAADSAFDRAEAMYPQYAEEIDPERLRAWITTYNAAVAAVQEGRSADAIKSLEAADAIYRKRPEALVTLGSLYMQLDQPAMAETALKSALEVIRGPERARQAAAQQAAWAEDEQQVTRRLTNLYLESERYGEAEALLREMVSGQPDSFTLKGLLAQTLERAGKPAEAAVIYAELLAHPDADEFSLFNVGIGLYRAEKFDDAAVAFRRALEKNTYSHDTQYNLAQALLARAGELGREKGDATADRKTAIDAELRTLYTELLALTETLSAIDPANRQIFMVRAESQRNLGELSTGAAANEWRQKVLATLEAAEAMPIDVAGIVAVPGDKTYQISGRVTNLKLPEGTPVVLRFVVLNREGAEVATKDVTVNLTVTEESRRFTETIEVPEGAGAWKYTIVR